MNIQATNGIVSSAKAVCDTVKSFVIWGGHKIQAGFANYLVPTVKSIWTGALASLKTIANFLRTPAGLIVAASVGLFALGAMALHCSFQKDYDDQEHKISQTAWRAIGASSIAAAVAGIGFVLIAV